MTASPLDLDPHTDWLRIHQHTALTDFAEPMRTGLTAAFYSTFAVPTIAEILVGTGEMGQRPAKRSYDTGLAIYEVIAAGFESERGREVVRFLNRVHHGLGIGQDLFTYTLCAFIVIPIRWIDRHGWRPLADVERDAAHRFYIELGRRMSINDLPATWQAAADWLDHYDEEHVTHSAHAENLLSSTLMLVRDRLPKPLRPLTRQVLATYFPQRRTRVALGLPRPWIATPLMNMTYWRSNRHRRRNPQAAPEWTFVPGGAAGTVYPDGYTLDLLGPPRKTDNPAG